MVCPGFDADLASSYLEGALGNQWRYQFEDHLAGCPTCRYQLIELSRLAPVAAAAPRPVMAEEETRRPWWEGVTETLAGWRERWAWRWSWPLAGAAVAAMALLSAGIVWQFRDRSDSLETVAVRQAEFPNPGAAGLIATANDSPTPAVEPTVSATAEIPRPRVQVNPAPTQQQIDQLARRANPTISAERSVQPANDTLVANALRQMAEAQQQMGRQAFLNPDPRRVAPAPLTPGPTGMLLTFPSEPVARIEPSPDDNPMRAVSEVDQRSARSRESRPAGSSQSSVWRDRLIGGFMPRDKSEREEKKKSDVADDETINPLVRKVQDKTFVYDRGFWVDQAYRDNLMAWRVVRLVLGSKEYERVLQEQPNLKEFFKLRPVIVVGRDKVYRVVEH